MPCQPGRKDRTDGGLGGKGDAMEVGWGCFYRKCARRAMPARLSDTIFFKTVTHWRPFAGAGKVGRDNSDSDSPVDARGLGKGMSPRRRRAGRTVRLLSAPCARPVHICLDSVGGQAIVVPFRGQLAQMDRALASGAKGHRFESCIAHHATLGGVFAARRKRPFCVPRRSVFPPRAFCSAHSLCGPSVPLLWAPCAHSVGQFRKKIMPHAKKILSVFPDANDRAHSCIDVTHRYEIASRHAMRCDAVRAPARRHARKPSRHKANGPLQVLPPVAAAPPRHPLWARTCLGHAACQLSR